MGKKDPMSFLDEMLGPLIQPPKPPVKSQSRLRNQSNNQPQPSRLGFFSFAKYPK